MQVVFSYLKPLRVRIAVTMIIKFAGTILELSLPWMLSHIIDDVVPLRNIGLVYRWGVIMVLAAALAWGSNVLANRLSIGVSRQFTRRMRKDLFERITALSSRQVDRFTQPSLVSRLTTDTYYVHQMVDRTQRLGVRAPIHMLGGICITLMLEPVLSLIVIATLPILFIVVFFVSRKGVGMFRTTQRAQDRMVRKIQEFMTGVRVIKALSKTEYEKGRFGEVSTEVSVSEQKASTLMAVTNPALNLFLNASLTLVILLGAVRVNAGLTGPGVIIAFLTYFTIILNSIMMIARLLEMLSCGIASAARLQEVFDEPRDQHGLEPNHEETGCHIEFDDVCFSYNGSQQNVSHISFRLGRGQMLGIIGPTGSGKSTIINLLLRFYDVDSGEIRIDGDRIESIPPDELYSMFGVAFQNDFLFADTLRENVAFGRPLDDEQLEAAIARAQADFVEDKEGGLDYELSVKGSNLSGGQKQRILIARALAARPDILILDDSSSALDYKTDAELRSALRNYYSETTSVIVAQRISSVMHADHILMLEDGKVIGSGTHEELMASNESYREIYQVQMGDKPA